MPPPATRIPRVRLPLLTPRLRLRRPRAADARVVSRALQDREVTRTVPLWPRYTLGDAHRFFQTSRELSRSGLSYRMLIELRATSEVVGTVGVEVIPGVEHRLGHLGYWVARPHWGHGYATEAASRGCELAFDGLKLRRLETGIVQGNVRSRGVLLRLGFRSEGVAREHFWIDGVPVDMERFGLLAREFRRYRPDRKASREEPSRRSR